MSAAINVVCYKWKTLANGESPLMVRVAKGGKRTMQSLGISINPKYWDFTRNKPKPNCPNKEYIQKIILDKQRELQQRMLELNVEQKEYTTTTLLNNENTGSNHQIFNDKIVESNGLFSLYSKLLLELRRGHSCHFFKLGYKIR